MIRPNASIRLLLALFVSLVAACGEDDTQRVREQPTVQIIAHTISLRTDVATIEAVGTARARAFAEIYPDTGGEVVEVGFSAGERVTRGTVLVQLDAREEQLAVARARVAVKDAEQLLNRVEQLRSTGAVSVSEIDAARTALDGARIDLQLAEVALEERTVRAPFDGFVGLTDIDPGARITTQTIITRLDDREVLYVDFEAPEQIFGRIRIGDRIPMAPFADPTGSYEAIVRNIDSRINADRRSFTIRAEIDNSSDELRPGMSFRVGFELPGQSYPSVPEAAIVWGGDGAYLWLVRDGKAARVPVTIISRQKGEVLVRAPIGEGDVIVAEGVQKVREGTEVVDPALASEQASTPTGAAITP